MCGFPKTAHVKPIQMSNELIVAVIGAVVGAVASHFAQNTQGEKISLINRLSKLEMKVNDVENTGIQLQGRVQSLETTVAEIKSTAAEIRQEFKDFGKEMKQEFKTAVSEIKAEMKK